MSDLEIPQRVVEAAQKAFESVQDNWVRSEWMETAIRAALKEWGVDAPTERERRLCASLERLVAVTALHRLACDAVAIDAVREAEALLAAPPMSPGTSQVEGWRGRETGVSILGSTKGGVAARWRSRISGHELVCVAVKAAEGGVMVLPIERGRSPHPLDWIGSEEAFLRLYEALPS